MQMTWSSDIDQTGVLTSNGHVNKCSINNSCILFFSFIFKNDFPIQKCQLFKVDFHIHIFAQFYHESES